MKKKLLGKIAVCTLAFSLFGSGVYAGTVIKSYKTPRGDIATVEKEEIHKNRIALEVDGKKVKKSTLYLNQTTYVPLKDAAQILGAEVNYDSKTMTAQIKSISPHNGQKVIKKSQLPYTITDKTNDGYHMVVTILSIKETDKGTVVRVKVTNKARTAYYFEGDDWRLYGDNKYLGAAYADDYLRTFAYDRLGSNQTVEGDFFLPEVPAGTQSVIIRYNSGYTMPVSLHFDLNS
ncbi:stalk domain-containing protein [Pseudobacillus badius]|uniref:stalk domain-containing protein n=1 Tax=Bacillus badius TaxID=1455 RepID=UPI0024A394BD|nr:stalk domain-containing protein [Bacillus badius]GLY12193.1 hypothetical protein Bbad01_34090 [Bacillus badius]